MAREDIPMTASARDSLIAISFLWVLFGVVVGFRLVGRLRGVGVGADDIFALSAFVRFCPSDTAFKPMQTDEVLFRLTNLEE